MVKNLPRKSHLSRRLISLAVASCFATGVAFANPTAPTVVNGSASILRSGNLLQITNSPNAIINWGSFSIGASEITRFIQQSQASAVLNRVIGQDPSSILGALQSNGRVFLINPNGILFGAGAQIDVAGLVASSLNLSNADFLAGKLKFTEVPGAGSIVNQGNITTQQGGNVYLVAPDITNSGIITSPKGEVVLAAGKSVELVNPGTPNLRVEITAPDNEARNLGQIVADSGRVGIYAGLINHSGTIRADSAVVGENGQILLKATKNVTLDSGSVTSANGPSGGKIEIQSGDTTLVAGTIEAKGTFSPPSEGGVSPAGDGVVGEGGTIHILGNRVGLIDNARIDASGQTGGGTVLIGGDFQGKNPDVQNAWRTYFGPSATIKADAIEQGDGGKVIVWADDWTKYYGSISARGGAAGGNGGSVEVSGKQSLDFNGAVDVGARSGNAGSVLLDPTSITIVAGASGSGANDGEVADGTVLFTDGSPGSFTITNGALQALSGDITLQSEAQTEVNASLNLTNQTTGTTVKFQAGGNMNVNSPITTAGGSLILVAGDPAFSATSPTPGLIIASGANLTTNGGDITLQNQKTATGGGINIGANVNAGSGIVHMTTASGGIGQQPGAVITASALEIQTVGGVTLNESNNVGTLAASVSSGDDFTFKNAQTLVIGTVGGVSGITTSGGNVTLNAGNSVTINAPIDMSVGGDFNVTTGSSTGTMAVNSLVTAGGAMNLNLAGGLVVQSTGQSAQLLANTGQTISAKYVEVISQGPSDATITLNNSGTQSITTSGMNASGEGVLVTALGSSTLTHIINLGSGPQNITLNNADFLRVVGAGAGSDAHINSNANQTILVQGSGLNNIVIGDATALGSSGLRIQGNQSITAAGGLRVESSTGSSTQADINSQGGQTISAKYVEVIGHNSAGADISNATSGSQTITTTGMNAAGEGILVKNLGTGPSASIRNGSNGPQVITVNNANFVRVMGQNGDAHILGGSGTGTQTILVQGSGSNIIELGDIAAGGTTGDSTIRGNNQSITAGIAGQLGGIRIRGGVAEAKFSKFDTAAGTQTISTTGDLLMTGGTAVGATIGGEASILSNGTGLQSVTANGINLTGGSSGTNNFAKIESLAAGSAGQTITAGAGGIVLTGGNGTANNSATIRNFGTAGTQTVTVNGAGTLALDAGDAGSNNLARIINLGVQQSITAGSGGIVTLGGGGTGTNNQAQITQSGATGTQTITINNGGTVHVEGGAGAGGNNFARIQAQGPAQTLNFNSGGAININGGTVGNGNVGSITTGTGNQSITGAPSITLTGGASGGTSANQNAARIEANGVSSTQNITAGSITLDAGLTTGHGGAFIFAQKQTISAAGDVVLTSRTRGARIGGPVDQSTDLTLTATGSITLNGIGTSAIGTSAATVGASNVSASPQTALVTVVADGDITLNAGADEARIGQPGGTLTGGGNISVTSTGGNIALNGTGAAAAAMRTLGNVTLHADSTGKSITEQSAGIIQANTLTATAHSGITLNGENQVTNFNATNTAANGIQFTNAAGTLLTVTGISQSGGNVVITADDLDISGAVSTGANTVTLRPTTLTQNINIESTPTGGVMSLTPSEIQQITAGTLEIGRLTDTGSLHVSTPIASSNINAGTLRLQHQNVFVDANIGSFGAEFNHNLEIKAIDTNTIQNGANILLADNNNLLLSVGTNPVGPSLTLGGGTLATTIQVGTTASNTGSMTLQGRGVVIGASGSGADTIVRVFGSGNQTITSTGDITFENASTTSGILLVRTEDGAQTITAAGTLQILGGTGTNTSASVQTVTGLQTVSANSILVHGGDSGTGNFVNIVSGGNQDVSASSGITLTGGASGGGLNTGNSAVIQSSGNQSISVGNGGLTLTGGGGVTDNSAFVGQAGLTGTSQTITVSGGGTITLQGGSGTQTSVGFPHGSLALIRADGDLQQIDFTAGGAINATGGTVGSRNFASIFSANGAQTITGTPSITLTGGASGGVAGEGNNASISASVGTQTITAGTVVLTGGAGGTNNSANIGSGSDQSVSASGITLTGGSSGDSNFADIHQQGASASQAITVNAGGTVALQGGGGSNNFARIRNDGTGQQTINFASGGAITIAGGSGTASDFAQIRALAGTQTISGSPAITLTGGTGGSPSQGNFAIIIANADAQTITAGATTITAGANGTNNFATIESPSQTITVNGDLTLTGGGSVSGPVNGAGARIGGIGGATTGPTNLALTVTGNVTVTGGSAADAGSAIGSNFAGGQATDITMNVGGNFNLNPGTVANAGSRIGSPTSNVAGGDISVTVGGNVSMNGSTHIRTLGAVTLDAAGSLTMTAGSGTSESVLIQSADTQMISASGITLTGGAGGTSNFAQILQTGTSATQTITINNGGTLALQAGAGNNNQAHIVNQGTLQTINFTSGGNLNITGGTVGQQNEANIDADSGNQVISGNPNITLQGGASGGASGFEGNQAGIVSNVGTQTISANNLSITGGGGINASAGIFADPGGAQTINVAGTTTLTGGSGIDSVAFIGGDIGNINVTLNATGPVTITGGTGTVGAEGFGALAGIGAPGGFNADVTINGQAGITLNKGATGGQGDAFIGSDTGGGTITLKAGLGGAGSIALNDGRVGTTGTVTMQATATGGQITQTAAGVIRAATLTASANSGISLSGANDFTQLVLPSAGSVTLNDVNAIVLNGVTASGALSVTAGGAITQSGAITVSDASSFSAGANPITLTNSGNDFTGAVSLNNSGPNNVAITDANAIVLGTSSVGTGTLTVIATGANTTTQTGAIVQAPGAGVASFQTGGGAITLTHAGNDFTGPIDAGAGLAAVAITDANALIILGGGGADTIGDFTLNANGMVSQSGALLGTAGNVVINAGVGPVVITDPGNNFVATSLSLNTTGAASLVNNNVVNLGTSSIGGAASLTAGGAVTQSGPVTVGGTASINAGANPITLTNSGNSFGGAVSLSNTGANDAAIVNSVTLNLGASNVGRDLTASASGAGSNLNLSGASAVGGNAGLTAGQDVNLGAGLSVGSNLTLAGGGHVRVTDATVSAGGALSVNASFLDITANAGPARLQAGTNLSVAAGDVTLQGGSVNAASAELRAGPGAFGITTTGNVLLTGGSGVGAFSRIFGDPDANMTVGGVLQMNAGSGAGAFAVIEAASVASINLIFPNLVSGGYFVNAVEGALFDAATGSGFIAGGAPAAPGQGFNVSYGLAAPTVITAPLLTAQIVATEEAQQTAAADPMTQELGQATSTVSAASVTVNEVSSMVEGPAAVTDAKEDKKEAAAPICR